MITLEIGTTGTKACGTGGSTGARRWWTWQATECAGTSRMESTDINEPENERYMHGLME